jgi:hypothetical protein
MRLDVDKEAMQRERPKYFTSYGLRPGLHSVTQHRIPPRVDLKDFRVVDNSGAVCRETAQHSGARRTNLKRTDLADGFAFVYAFADSPPGAKPPRSARANHDTATRRRLLVFENVDEHVRAVGSAGSRSDRDHQRIDAVTRWRWHRASLPPQRRVDDCDRPQYSGHTCPRPGGGRDQTTPFDERGNAFQAGAEYRAFAVKLRIPHVPGVGEGHPSPWPRRIDRITDDHPASRPVERDRDRRADIARTDDDCHWPCAFGVTPHLYHPQKESRRKGSGPRFASCDRRNSRAPDDDRLPTLRGEDNGRDARVINSSSPRHRRAAFDV